MIRSVLIAALLLCGCIPGPPGHDGTPGAVGQQGVDGPPGPAGAAGPAGSTEVNAGGGVSRISTNAVLCGTTAPTKGVLPVVYISGVGTVSGTRSGKLMCEQACSSPAAHMCSGDEYLRSAQLDLLTSLSGTYWLATGSYSPNGSTGAVRDCLGWTFASGSEFGMVVRATTGTAFRVITGVDSCSYSHSILCCL